MPKNKLKCGYKLFDGSICGSENIACISIINEKEIPTCHNHQFVPYDLNERRQFNDFICQEEMRVKIQRKMRRERNKNINLLKYDEKRKSKKIERLNKELNREKKLLEKIQKKIILLEKS